ncbi:BnaA01g36510D [Brassica napus]|uniref:BnaA01g36510D protein n=1 Tax=Brassica napus TaxID=3708 RepID=A0A078K0P5_BRANA|nr:BnaA01g36510D [Brassica napus]
MFHRRYRMSRLLFLRIMTTTSQKKRCNGHGWIILFAKRNGRISDVSRWPSCSFGRFRKIKDKESHFVLRNSN